VRARGLIPISAAVAALCAGCAQQQQVVTTGSGTATSSSSSSSSSSTTTASAPTFKVRPHAVQPVAGTAGTTRKPPPAGTSASVSVESPSHDVSLARPLSNAQVRAALNRSGMTANADQATLTPNGLAVAPPGAPAEVQAIINAGNEIARLPYRYAGGHLTYQDTAYDCSGSISYVLAAAHLLNYTVNSTALESWGKPGPGKWVTVFANAGHTFMYVAGLRFDTVALAETGSRWSTRPADEPDLATFVLRHPAGL
jgi:cell wall-associated NlpC family hydrolase